MNADLNVAFTLRLQLFRADLRQPLIVIKAFSIWPASNGGARMTVEVRHGGKVIFPRGTLTCSLPPGHSTDGIEAREHVLFLVGMRPGDTDQEYFEGYTPDQLAWATKFGESISCEREARYCDENGSVRHGR